MKRRVFFGLGSNLGDRLNEIGRAVDTLPDVVRVSSIFETDPVGGPEQGRFYNCVVESFTSLPAHDLLQAAKSCEFAAKREPSVVNGPRTLDVDILMIEGETIDDEDLTVPHPRMYERRFVIEPFSELAPELLDPGLLNNATGRVVRLGTLAELAV